MCPFCSWIGSCSQVLYIRPPLLLSLPTKADRRKPAPKKKKDKQTYNQRQQHQHQQQQQQQHHFPRTIT